MKDNTCTIRCDRCKAATVEIEIAWLQPWEEVNDRLRALGWIVEKVDICPKCAELLTVDTSERPA